MAMAPLALLVTDNIAAWTLRDLGRLVFGQGNNSSLGATVEKRGPSKNFVSVVQRIGCESTKLAMVVRFHPETPKLCTVRLSVRTPAFHAGKRSSILLRCTIYVDIGWDCAVCVAF